MDVRSRSSAELTGSHYLIRAIAYLLAWAVLLAAIGLIAAYLSPARSGSAHIEEPGQLRSPGPTPVPTPAGPAASAAGSPITLISVTRGTSQAAAGMY